MKKILVCLLVFLVACGDGDAPEKTEDISEEDIGVLHTAGVRIASGDEQTTQVIPESFAIDKMTEVTKLDFNGENISVVPDWLATYSQLRKLDLYDVGLSNGSEAVLKLIKLKDLEELDLSDNPLFSHSTDSDTFSNLWKALPKLRVLKLGNVDGNTANFGDLSKLESLEELDLSHNAITEIKPLKLSKLTKLRKLNLAYNRLSAFSPEDIPMASLKELYLQHNNISELAFVNDLPNLEILDLSENGKIKIDDRYGSYLELKQLTQLIIDKDAQVLNDVYKKLERNNYIMARCYQDNQDGTITVVKTKSPWMPCSLGQTFRASRKDFFQDALGTTEFLNNKKGYADNNGVCLKFTN